MAVKNFQLRSNVGYYNAVELFVVHKLGYPDVSTYLREALAEKLKNDGYDKWEGSK